MRLHPTTLLALLCLTACVCTREPGRRPIAGSDEARAEHGAETPAETTLTKLGDRAGYRIRGPEGLEGTLTHDGRQWHLDAAFAFPTAGYTVRELEVAVLKRLPEEVHITIPYQPPPVDAVVAQVVTTVPVTWSGFVRKNATFVVQVYRVPPQTAAEAGA